MTVPFEAQDFISGAVRNIRKVLRGATDDLLDFRRASGQMGDDLVSNLRRSRSAADDLGSRISNASDETRRLGRANVDDLFRRARSGADDLRRSASRADAEIRGMSDSRVHIRAKDDVSPVLDTISSKIATITATAGAMLLGGGLKDAMFSNVMEYNSEAARSAPFLPENFRQPGLAKMEDLVKQGIIPNKTEGATLLADASPLMKDKNQVASLAEEVAKSMYIRPDSGKEENLRAISQVSKVFGESPSKANDSINYAYKMVGDPQQDVNDTFWEYSGYFKNAGSSSAQMANFLGQSLEQGAFNFDKPADFFKETFGVKALNTGDMETYFKLRGSGKDEAARQASDFTTDINSGDTQRSQGAIAALVADFASQTRSELKASLVSLGSAAAEDNADAILKTYAVPFQKAPDVTGTTDQLLKTQQDANPMIDMIRTRNEINLQMQDIGANLSTAVLPALKEFNDLLTENKDDIQAISSNVVGFVSGLTSIYSEHFTAINTGLLLIGGSIATIKGTKFVKGLVDDTIAGSKKARGWLSWGKTAKNSTPTEEVGTPTKKRFSLQRGGIGGNGGGVRGLGSASPMTINASVVYLNEAGGGLGGNGRNKKRRGGRGSKRGGRGLGLNSKGTNNRNTLGGRNKDAIGARRGTGTTRAPNLPDVDVAPAKARVTYRSPTRLNSPSSIPDVIPDAPKGGMIKGLFKGGKKALKAAGIVGTVAGIGFGGYDLYQATKKDGIRSAISSTGGSMLGGTAGGIVGGVVGSLAGPIGTAVGAAAGGWVGEKLGSMADNAGWTKKAVDGIYSIGDWITGKKKETPAAAPVAPPESKVTFGNMTPEKTIKLQKAFESFRSDVSKNGLKQSLSNAMDQNGVTQTVDKIKDRFVGMLKSTDSKKAQDNIRAVGTVSQKAGVQTKQLGQTAKSSTQEIVQGAGQAGKSFGGISSAAKSAVSETRSHLMGLQNISSQGSSWGSNLISMMTSGIRSKFPSLSAAVSDAAGVIKNFLGFHSPTKEGPASNSDKWAGNFVSMFAGGLKSDSIRQKMTSIAGTLRSGVQGIQGPQYGSMVGSGVPIAQTLNQASPATPKAVTIQNINIDFGELAKGITDFAQFAKMMTSPQGRALIRQVFGEELYKVLENGG
ncbi:tail tape measure protein [Paenibacillus glacialis]|uniref:Phage tail tape measure protein domain-containing protein n=1 Tax=Paenibacillus glacialis TaxID=494026 RepID=A0A168DE85_9BACL|nr:tail tape measure protein [Paenibacillus glacialis]OAB34118.1 hypothetical protein PGLA_24805 [Paenibacillus glacialis]